MTTIAYDRPVKDLIDELNATGHVTHVAFKKTSVTLHHNAGRLSHEGVLEVWKTRPASAHFDVDAAGAVAQYVLPNEYAWAVGDRAGNESTISIEMANSALAPTWAVGETTWKSAARLAGWLFAKIVKQRPSASNFFQHSHWSATACAGPYITSIWSKVLGEAQRSYDYFTQVTPPPPSKPEWTTDDVEDMQKLLKTYPDGKWGTNTDIRAMAVRAVANPKIPASEAQIILVQRILGVNDDGIVGPITSEALDDLVRDLQKIFHVTPDGDWWSNTDDHFLRFRKEKLYNY